jgi:signal transduction histidine kinase
VQTTDQWEQHPEAGGERAEALQLAVHPVPACGTDRPIVVVKGEQAGLRPDESGGVEPLQASRTERLERELRETRRELRDMVQKYEGVQRRLQRANETLQKKNELLEERAEQVRSLSEAVTMAEENERERLSHVLHDDLQQVLYAVRTKVDLVVEQEGLDEQGKRLLSRSLDLLDDGIETTRTLASALNPPMENSLWDTLEWLTIQMQEAYGLSVEMCAKGDDRTTDKSLQVLVVRLVRELLFNVVKHAGTQEAALTLTKSEDQLHVVVADDGEGFDPDELEENESGFGLASVRRRLELVGGSFEVDATPGEGTRVRLGVPFQFEGAGSEAGIAGGDKGSR